MMHLWAKWYVKAAVVVVAASLGAFVSGILANSWALHMFANRSYYYVFGRYLATETLVSLFTLAGGIVGFIITFVVVLFGYFVFRLAQLKLLWRRRMRVAMVVLAVVVAVGVFTLGAWAGIRLEARVSALEKSVHGLRSSTGESWTDSFFLKGRVDELERQARWSELERALGR